MEYGYTETSNVIQSQEYQKNREKLYQQLADRWEYLLKAQQEMQMMNWFCSDVMVRGAYPYYSERYFEENNIHN